MPLIIAFSGQGSQHNTMFNLLSSDIFGKSWMQEASEILHINLFDKAVVEKACSDGVQAQCLIVVLSVGVFYALKQQAEITPAFLCGYSLGEVSAFCASTNMGLVSICDSVSKRAYFMQQACNSASGLAALKGNINLHQVQKLVDTHTCYIAIINGDNHYIVGGKNTDLTDLIKTAKNNGVIKAERLPVNLPAHTPLLTQATTNYGVYLQNINVGKMEYPILNALTQELIFNVKDMLPILAKELSETLHWDSIMRIAEEYGTSCFLELGPGTALKNMAQVAIPTLKAYQMEGFSTLNGLADHLSRSNH